MNRTNPETCERNVAAGKSTRDKTHIQQLDLKKHKRQQRAATAARGNDAINTRASSRGTSSKAQSRTRGSLGYRYRKHQQRSEKRAVQSREQAEVIALELRVRHGELLV